MSTELQSVVVFGAGAIGATVGGWLVEAGVPVTFVARPGTAERLNQQGLQLHAHGYEDERRTIKVAAVSDIAGMQRPDWLVLAVKNYDLEAAARDIRARLNGEPTVIALQNGIENQAILPKYFARVVYGVIRYNAWRDAANQFGYERRGPIFLGVTDPTLVGFGLREIEDYSVFSRSVSRVMYEGMQILRKAGVQEVPMGGGETCTSRAWGRMCI